MTRALVSIVPVSAIIVTVTLSVPASAAAPKSYKNCAALNKVYAHGVGKPGAKDKTSDPTAVTNEAFDGRLQIQRRQGA